MSSPTCAPQGPLVPCTALATLSHLPSLAHRPPSQLRASATLAGVERSAIWSVPGVPKILAMATVDALQMAGVIVQRGAF